MPFYVVTFKRNLFDFMKGLPNVLGLVRKTYYSCSACASISLYVMQVVAGLAAPSDETSIAVVDSIEEYHISHWVAYKMPW